MHPQARRALGTLPVVRKDLGALAHRDFSPFLMSGAIPGSTGLEARCYPSVLGPSLWLSIDIPDHLPAGVWDRVAPVWTDTSASGSPGPAEHVGDRETSPGGRSALPSGPVPGHGLRGREPGAPLKPQMTSTTLISRPEK